MSSSSWRSVPLPSGWAAIQHGIILRDPVCRWGMLDGEDGPCLAPSTDADHIGAAWDHDPAKMRGLCHPHHVTRSAAQARAVLAEHRAKKVRPRQNHPGYR